MIKLKPLLSEDLKRLSLQQVIDGGFFGPVYHGTSQENLAKIGQEGFKITKGLYGTAGMTQGYQPGKTYGNTGIPAPIHHLGFGSYFTTVKTIAKKFAGGTTKGMKPYYLDIPRKEVINFGSENNMMKWWIKNGYDPELAKQGEGGRYQATLKMTEELSSKYDGVWFKGESIRRLLDGNQVVVFDTNNIYLMDKTLIKPWEIGSRVVSKNDIDPYGRGTNIIPKNTVGMITEKRKSNEMQTWAAGSDYIYNVKFGGLGEYSILPKDIEPL